ncbi:MAG: TonB-dependent receptor [Parafilimonas sp.]|nr:TonB-dependent receptor [Parafilimonas sp.]
MNAHKFIITCSLLLSLSTAIAQSSQLISGDFSGLNFSAFTDKIESSYPYHFYFDKTETDSITVNIVANNYSIQQLLEAVLKGTSFHFAVDSLNRVFITNQLTVQTNFPQGYFSPVQKIDTTPPENSEEETTQEPKEALRVSIENKLLYIGKGLGTGNATIAGYVRDMKSGEPIIGASVYIDTPRIGVNTDQYGYFSLTMPKGYHTIKILSTGMKETKRQVVLNGDGKLNIDLEEYVANLKTVTVRTEKNSNTRSLQMGANIVSIKTIKQIPVVFGEADISKVVLALPGVTSVGEASNGFNVRGGSVDQNLILFSDATVYNSSHLFGFFSSFNPDVVKGIELYKSSIPEKYGGRLSSVLDVDVKDGNTKKWSGAAGIGPLTSKFYIEGPLAKDKTSVIASIRSTYSDWLLNQIPNTAYNNSTANFNDFTLRLSHTINAKNSLYITGYFSNDRFRLNRDTLYAYSNKNANIKWKHIYNNKLFMVITGGVDHYDYSVSSEQNEVNAFKLSFNINQYNFRTDFTFSPNSKNRIDFGLSSIYYKLQPGALTPVGGKSLVVPSVLQNEQALENALYLGDEYSVTSDLSIDAGVRYSVYNYLGPHTVNSYVEGIPKDTTTITSTADYAKGKVIQTYAAPEFRISTRYSVSENASLKASFNTMQQFIHLLTNTTTISPTDIWKLSDPNIKPQNGYQVSLGYYQNFNSNTIETSVEVYYKRTKNYLDYRSGADLILNPHIETDVIATRGKAYGIEFLVKKNAGKLNGWLSYTYSRTLLQSNDISQGEIVNKGAYYPASFDKPNSLNFISNYQFSHRYNISLNVVYSTGRPITLPLAVFNSGGTTGLYYSDRNAYRIPDYFRTDISMNIDGNHKVHQKFHNSWSFGVYNLTGRKNVYSVYFIQQDGVAKGYQLSIFGTLIPFVTYSIRF